ncbi:gamma-glutamyl peptidase 5-like [Salvia hispanica]|uniref:gamma-glutamyl peptidase 5-like n=1 Tax=Salvia hispanica TaxID=49212 RepID=UPI002008F39D|nr:gamma-glutamyl peptidase 5-like [Salvia hispanica]
MGGQKFGILLCADDSEYVKKLYGGYYGVFVRMLKEEGESWDLFRVARGDFPADDQIADYDGFVISGSCSDAYADDLWICNLLILLNKLRAMNKKLLGICFGHQILGRAIGGKIGRAKGGWDIGITQVQLYPSKIFTSLNLPTSLSIIECHRDEVLTLPPEAEVLAWSERTGVEMFRYGDHIMGIQGHPEYTKGILSNLIDRLSNCQFIEESVGEEGKTRMEKSEPDMDVWWKLCTSFLKGRL